MPSEIKITHIGREYFIDPASLPKPHVEFVRDYEEGKDFFAVYKCQRDHRGPDVFVLLKNPNFESDGEGGYDVTDCGLYWSDDKTQLDDDLADAYGEAIREDWGRHK